MSLAIPGILRELLDWGTSEVGIIAMGKPILKLYFTIKILSSFCTNFSELEDE